MTDPTIEITPCFWFDLQAEEAARFYTDRFEHSAMKHLTRYGNAGYETHKHEAGTVLMVDFELAGQHFTTLNGGPHFPFTPAISFFVYCKTEKEVDRMFARLSSDGEILMPLQEYPFSKKYAWIQDQYGVSWQLYLGESMGQKIVPTFMFTDQQSGQAEAAMKYYMSIFEDGKMGEITRYGKRETPDEPGTVKHATFWLNDQEFKAMDSKRSHGFTFNEALSLMIFCQNQDQIDYFWEKLSAHPEAEQCGWLKDKYGVSWQVVPAQITDLLQNSTSEEAGRVMEAMMTMKKIDLDTLTRAHATSTVKK